MPMREPGNYRRGSCSSAGLRYARSVTSGQALAPAFGTLLKEWRARRRISQLALAAEADVSARHIGFMEVGRSNPSREMVLRLADRLSVPLRERNAMLVAAGYAPVYRQRSLEDTEMQPVREAVELVLAGHDPYPAVAVDRYWNVVQTNTAASVFTELVDPRMLEPPINVYRVSLHPDGLASAVGNFPEYAAHLLARLRQDIDTSGDPDLAALLREVESYPTVRGLPPHADVRQAVVLPMRLRHGDEDLALFTTITVFGTPVDVTVAEMAIESFFPADAETARFLRGRAA